VNYDAAGDKQKKLQEKRRAEAKKKLLQQKRQKELAEEIQRSKDQREEERCRLERLAEARRDQLLYETAGVTYSATLKVVPDSRIDDKAILPQSAFAVLNEQSVFDKNDSGILTFRLRVGQNPDSVLNVHNAEESDTMEIDEPTVSAPRLARDITAVTEDGSLKNDFTHCGVTEFTAEEGTIRFGPKVLLSLLEQLKRAEGGSRSNDLPKTVEYVDVQYVQIRHYTKCKCVFQPKAQGFFDEGKEVVNIDLRAILEKQLAFHTCLTEGDIVVVRDPNIDNKTYYLSARLLEPDEHLILINTEMQIEVLPSEEVEYNTRLDEMREERARKKKEALDAEIARRISFVEGFATSSSASSFDNIPSPGGSSSSPSSADLVDVNIKLPHGKTVSAKFLRTAAFSEVFRWLDSHTDTLDYTFPQSKFGQDPYDLVQSFPGQFQAFTREEAGAKSFADYRLGRREQFFFKAKERRRSSKAAGVDSNTGAQNAGKGGSPSDLTQGGPENRRSPEFPKAASDSQQTSPLDRFDSTGSAGGLQAVGPAPSLPSLPANWAQAGETAFQQMDRVNVADENLQNEEVDYVAIFEMLKAVIVAPESSSGEDSR